MARTGGVQKHKLGGDFYQSVHNLGRDAPVVVVVLGMHRSGTSMVGNVLHHLGVNMGDNLLGANRWNPYGHYEDVDFFGLNVEILKAAGGDWAHPPEAGRIWQVGRWFSWDTRELVEWKLRQGRRAWGWKDPRTALTAAVWADALERAGVGDVRYVRVVRSEGAVVDSLMRRAREVGEMVRGWVEEGKATEEEAAEDLELAGWGAERWLELVRTYEERIWEFLEGGATTRDAPTLFVGFEEMVSKPEDEVGRLAEFVGAPAELVPVGVGRIARAEDKLEV